MKTDSKHDSSPAPDRAKKTDDAVDFRREAPSESDVAALSGGKSGSSVLAWDELVRQQSADDEVDLGGSDVKIDSASDQDILREVLAGEKPPSKIIPRSGSDPEVMVDTPTPPNTPKMARAQPTETVREFPTAARGKAPTDTTKLTATRIEDDDDASFHIGVAPESAESSSILSSLGIKSSSADQSDASTGSRVDLLAHLRPKGGSGVISRKNLPAPPSAATGADAAQFGDEFSDDDQSSSVDLGSRPAVEMPFPLGIDSSVGSSVVATNPRIEAGSSLLSGDSAAVDLMASDEFNLYRQPGMSSVADALRGNSAHELPPTVPMTPLAMDRLLPWIGGSVVGLLVSALLFTGLYFGGIVRFESQELGKPIIRKDSAQQASANPGGDASQNAGYATLLAELNKQGLNPDKLDGIKQRLADADAAKVEATDARAKLTKTNEELQTVKADQEKQAQETQKLLKQVAQLNDQVQRAGAGTADSTKTAEQTRVAAQKALQEAEGKLAELRTQQEKKMAETARALEDRIRAETAEADAARKALAEFTHSLNLKLADANLVAANAKPTELLSAVEKALQRPTSAPVHVGSYDSLQADRLFSAGIRAYRDRDFAESEKQLAAAAKANERDARIRYMLGLARIQLGRNNDAQADFYAAAALERQYQPSPRDVDETLARLPVSDRSIVGQYRP
jgi:hypothetical protein